MVRPDVKRRRSPALREFHGLYTQAPEMDGVLRLLGRVAPTASPVLVVGESGTGKELVARAIHAESDRRNGPFQAMNCANFSATLLESQLFGHVRGAFTGAVRDQSGLFTLAHGGTLFLDEVTEIPLELQGKLLRALEDKSFLPVGGTRSVTVDVRLISASNRPIRDEVAAGRFRADLSYRIRVVPLYLPPLRARTGDVDALLWHFVREMNERGPRRVTRVTRPAMEAIRRYPWPGNVRELRSVVEYAFVAGEGSALTLHDLTPELRGEPTPGDGFLPVTSLRDGEREFIVAALARHRGGKAAVARELGISRQTLWRKLRAHHLT
jgi:two-component system, NtrC family, response regulator AtoC